jgi:hypothetical protein
MVLSSEAEYSVPSGPTANAFTSSACPSSVLTHVLSVIFHTLLVSSSERECSVLSRANDNEHAWFS